MKGRGRHSLIVQMLLGVRAPIFPKFIPHQETVAQRGIRGNRGSGYVVVLKIQIKLDGWGNLSVATDERCPRRQEQP